MSEVKEKAVSEVRVGFEAALDIACPTWKTDWKQEQVDMARFFYSSAIRDSAVFVNNAISNMKEGYDWMNKNLEQTNLAPPVVDDCGMNAAIQAADAEPETSDDTATATIGTGASSDAI